MARQNFRNVFLFTTLLIATFLSQSPRHFHVEGRTLQRRDTATTNLIKLTTSTYDASQTATPLTSPTMHQIPTTTEVTVTEATTIITDRNNPTSTESHSFQPTHNPNRSLYDELSSTSNFPNFSSFETSSEFLKFEQMKIGSDSEESKSMESNEKSKQDDQDNGTREERHMVNEATFDEETIKYSSVNISRPTKSDEEELETTALPVVLTTIKKGKYLGLVPPTDDNINASIPNTAEVWALAGMREVDGRKKQESDESSSDAEMSGGLNNTAKNLLDWIEIAKMNNSSMMPTASEDYFSTKSTNHNDIAGDDDPATSENKNAGVIVASQQPTATPSTLKTIIEDNRLELEGENVEFGGMNKTSAVNSRIDADVFEKSPEEKEESAVEIIDPLKKGEKKEDLRLEELENKSDFQTTASLEAFTTDSSEMFSTTTMESVESTTSIVDSFTVIGEDDENDEIFKRTITELPVTTDEPVVAVNTTKKPRSTGAPLTTTKVAETTTKVPGTTTEIPTTTTTTERLIIETTTEAQNFSVNEIPESTLRYNKSTKSIRATTTESPSEEIETTILDNASVPSTLIPKYSSTSLLQATTQKYDVIVESTTSGAIEIIDDDKFKYSTWLPETTDDHGVFKSGGFDELSSSTQKTVDSLEKENLDGEDTSSGSLGLISAIVSVIVVLVIAGVGYFIYKRRNMQKFSQRCRPVGLDAYSLDNVSVYNSVRRKARDALRFSKRSYGNSAFEDPSLQSNVLDYQSLQDFAKNKTSIQDEFKEIPQVSVRVDEMPENCEDKNRYANVVPLPETRVHLKKLNDDEKTEYINANFVKGPKDTVNYYIATQAPLENTVPDFWRMIWEQNSKVIIMATDLTENGVERCAEYIPASVVLDNKQTFGDFEVTLKSREVKGKYAVSQLHVKNLKTSTWREIMHLWYSWPENGCPTDEQSFINLLLDARGYLRTNLPEQLDENSNTENDKDFNDKEKLSTLDKTKSLQRVQGPLTVHCSPGTGRTGTLIACDIILRMLETPPRQIDIPQIVYAVRRGRANAIRTKDQYEFIYSIANAYAVKLNTAPAEH